MDTKTLKAMADRLQELANGAEPETEELGICASIVRRFGESARQKIKSLFVVWPEFSGNYVYPVSHGQKDVISAYYFCDKWSGEYGAARRRLCGFLAQEIGKEI